MSTFSDLLAASIKASGLTIPYLASLCGISPSLLAKMKSGQRLSDLARGNGKVMKSCADGVRHGVGNSRDDRDHHHFGQALGG